VFINLQANVFGFRGFKSGGFYFDAVLGSGEQGNQKVTAVVSEGVAGDIRRLCCDRNFGARYDRTGIVRDRSRETSGRLTMQERSKQTYQRTENYGKSRLLARH
jgi:hypothetical protein